MKQKGESNNKKTLFVSVATNNKKSERKLSIKTLCYTATLVALSVIANTYTVYLNTAGSNALSFTYTINFIAGALFGPVVGFLTGALGDLLGWLINPAGGAFNPFLTLTSGLLGLIPGIVFYFFKKFFSKKKNYIKLFPVFTVLSYILVWAVCTNLNTVIMYYFYIAGFSKKYTSFPPYYAYRIVWQTGFWAINLILSALLILPLKKLLRV